MCIICLKIWITTKKTGIYINEYQFECTQILLICDDIESIVLW